MYEENKYNAAMCKQVINAYLAKYECMFFMYLGVWVNQIWDFKCGNLKWDYKLNTFQ